MQKLTVLSALQASSKVMCTLCRVFALLRSACRDMPVDAASTDDSHQLAPFLELILLMNVHLFTPHTAMVMFMMLSLVMQWGLGQR